MLIEWVADIIKLSVFVAGAYAALHVYARCQRPHWVKPLSQRAWATVAMLILVVSGMKVAEEVVAKESGAVDEAMLWFVRDHVPPVLTGFFQVVTLSGSGAFLLPVTLIAAVALLIARRRAEALLLAASVITATLLVYTLKTIIGRTRPALWETQWYWGSSFPSGHTLSTAAFSIAAALCLARIWPRSGKLAMSLAMLWTGLVAVSRLVLGVHWPSDVLAAICFGVFIPLLISVVCDMRRRNPILEEPGSE